jgi:hypothetical protein
MTFGKLGKVELWEISKVYDKKFARNWKKI